MIMDDENQNYQEDNSTLDESKQNIGELKEVFDSFNSIDDVEYSQPKDMRLVVDEIINHQNASAKSYILVSKNNEQIPYFKPGQYISLKFKIGNSFISKPFSLSYSPVASLRGKYRITVKRKEQGTISSYILDNLQIGSEIIAAHPNGYFCYEPLRDHKNILAIVNDTGINPIMSFVHAIDDGVLDINLAILYSNKDSKRILFKTELDEIIENHDNIKAIYYLDNETKSGYKRGKIKCEDIVRCYDNQYSVFVCGTSDFVEYELSELKKIKKDMKEIRTDIHVNNKNVIKQFGFPKESINKKYTITIKQGPNKTIINAASNETLLCAIENAGIKVPSDCRSGKCGFCNSRLVKGTVFIMQEKEGRRYIEREYNYIHLCCSYAIDDCVIEIPGDYIES